LDVRTFWLREAIAQPEDLGQGVGLLLDRYTGRVVFLPHGDNYERNEHGVDHAQRRVDEACNVVVSLARGCGYEALHHLKTGERDEASPTYHKYAIDYGE
jgi:alkylhydroperoxidase family enzyme